MALQIEFTSTSGAAGNYLKIGSIIIQGSQVMARLDYFKDHQARLDGLRPYEVCCGKQPSYIITIDHDLPIYSQIYQHIKSLPDFAGAEDV